MRKTLVRFAAVLVPVLLVFATLVISRVEAATLVTLSGVVTTQDGTPLAGTQVSYIEGLSTTTAADGSYTLHVAVGSSGTTSGTLTFQQDTSALGLGAGSMTASAQITMGTTAAVENLTWPGLDHVDVYVRTGQLATPLVGAQVSVTGGGSVTLSDGTSAEVGWTPDLSAGPSCTTDASATCAVVVPDGFSDTFSASYTPPGGTTPTHTGSTNQTISADPSYVTVIATSDAPYVPPPVAMSGVVTQGGTPVAGTTVSFSIDAGNISFAGSTSTVTDANGAYTLSVPSGIPITLTFSQDTSTLGLGGGSMGAVAQLTPGSEAMVENFDWPWTGAVDQADVFVRTGQLATPLVGAQVTVTGSNGPAATLSDGTSVNVYWTPDLSTGGVCTTDSTATCAVAVPDGFTDYFNASYTPAGASSPTHTGQTIQTISANPSSVTVIAKLVGGGPPPPPPTVPLSGVVTQDGTPVAGMTVSYQPGGASTTTGPDGSYTVNANENTNGTLTFSQASSVLSGLGMGANSSVAASANVSVGTQAVTENFEWPFAADHVDVSVTAGTSADIPLAGVPLQMNGFFPGSWGLPSLSLSDGTPVTVGWSSDPSLSTCTTDSNGSCAFVVPDGAMPTFTSTFQMVPGNSSYPTLSKTVAPTISADPTEVNLAFSDLALVRSYGAASGSVRASSPDGTSISNVSSAPADPNALPPGALDLTGVLSYEVDDVAVGGSVDVTLQLPAGSTPTAVYKDVNGTYVDVSSIATIIGNSVVLDLTDGGLGDEDGVANGVIVDPVVVVGNDSASPTSVRLTANPTDPVAGAPVTLKATVSSSGAAPTGTVEFTDGGADLPGCSSVALATGIARCVLAGGLSGGTHAIRAIYSGSSSHQGSSSAISDVEVSQPTTTALTLSSPFAYGSESASGFMVAVTSSGASTLGGSVTVTEGTVTLCTLTLGSGGSGTCSPTAKALAPGTYSVRAAYTPTSGSLFLGSRSAKETLIVTPGPTSMTPAPASAVQKASQWKVTLSATLTLAANGHGLSNRSVVLALTGGSTQSCTATTSSTGLATCVVAIPGQFSASGATGFTATFAGNADYQSSSGSAAVAAPS